MRGCFRNSYRRKSIGFIASGTSSIITIGQPLFATGETAPGMFVLQIGRVQVTRRDPLGHLTQIVEQTAGDFVAEVEQLSGRPALVDVHAVGDIESALIPAENLRRVMIAEPVLGDRIMRALIYVTTTAGYRSASALARLSAGR